ncbi:AP-3 complex subunit delta [Chironomus tepperi]|uniref:AP-3 complex subunit delta n=1 Tax=Chironomus tepperi TaxID=113505 RepID=UPI00391F8066
MSLNLNIKQVKGNLQRLFDKNLTDLVRGLRNNKDNEANYIAQCIEEIKQELRIDNISVKCNAVAKLTYLQMCGYDISWAGFNIIEVMSSNKFTCKRVGYLAASQSFHPGTDLLMLTTNMIRKDLSATNQYDAGVALSGLSCFISPDLSRDLANDIMTLMSSTKPYLRMKAVLMMYKVFLNYPEALRPAFPKLKEKLEDPDPGVQSAAVNVICELARKNPKNYLSLAPIFFKLMTTSTNNWMLIKIIKLFGALTPIEPRLGKKLIEPLTNLIHSTSAMSLLYECINTVIAVLISISSGMPNHTASIQLCVQKLRILIEDSDQNLKYLGLLAMSKILKTHPKSVQAHKDLILACLDDKDESIRLRALDLLYGMVSKKNLMEIVNKLLGHMERAEGSVYRDELLLKVIEICSQESYQHVTNFEWYLTVLVELIQLEAGSKHGSVIADQLLDVTIRVESVRKFSVNEMTNLINSFPSSSQTSTMYEVLYAAAWIVGEFADQIDNPEDALKFFLQERSIPGHIQAVFVQNSIKVLTNIIERASESGDLKSIENATELMEQKLQYFISSGDIEVQERASATREIILALNEALNGEYETKNVTNQDLLNDIGDHENGNVITTNLPAQLTEILNDFKSLFDGELLPVAAKAQRKVQLPDGLNLDEWINGPPSESSSDEEDESKGDGLFVSASEKTSERGSRKDSFEPTPEELEKIREARKMLQAHNPNYLKSSSSGSRQANDNGDYDNIDDIPIAELNLDIPLKVHSKTKRSDKYLEESRKAQRKEKKEEKSGKKSKKKSKKTKKQEVESESGSEEEQKPVHLVNKIVELPEGATLSDSEDKNELDLNDPHRALGNINLEDVEEFYAPPQRTSKAKHVEESDSSKLKEKSHRKKKEQIPEQNLMIEEVNEKKDKKKHKRKKEIVNDDVSHEKSTDILDIEQKVKKSKKKSKDNDKKDTEKSKKHKKSSKKSEYEETL